MKSKPTAATVVVKIGSSTLTDERGKFRLGPMAGRVAEICDLHRRGHRIVLVSSGAVSSGMGLLKVRRRPAEVEKLQALAAVGQGRLFHAYSELFGHEEVIAAQVLLSAYDFAVRTNYVNARNTLHTLLEWGVVPIVNENDTTSTEELCFGDNDMLAAQVALLIRADLLILLTDTDGLYSANPHIDPNARLIREVTDFGELEEISTVSKGPLGRGGMASKVRAAKVASSGGVCTYIARGTRPGVITACVSGENVGTRFAARDQGLGAYKLWLLYGKPVRGKVYVDEGAVKAVCGNASLLPVGITKVEGTFQAGDAVSVCDERGREIARGIVDYSSDELELVKGLRSSEVSKILPHSSPDAIHRDYLVLVE